MVKRLLRAVKGVLRRDQSGNKELVSSPDSEDEPIVITIHPSETSVSDIKRPKALVIDSATGEVIKASQEKTIVPKQESREIEKTPPVVELPPNLPDDLMKLALINETFRQGIMAIEKLGLDEDLRQRALYDLSKKYYKERDRYMKPSQ